MLESDEIRSVLRQELLEYFLNEGFSVISAKESPRHSPPEPVHNDGYGDQRDKSPDILAYDPKGNHRIFGIVRTGDGDLETDASLTEYNVFLDQTDQKTGEPYRLYIILPASKIQDMTALITHYIHREYWFKVVLVSSVKITGGEGGLSPSNTGSGRRS